MGAPHLASQMQSANEVLVLDQANCQSYLVDYPDNKEDRGNAAPKHSYLLAPLPTSSCNNTVREEDNGDCFNLLLTIGNNDDKNEDGNKNEHENRNKAKKESAEELGRKKSSGSLLSSSLSSNYPRGENDIAVDNCAVKQSQQMTSHPPPLQQRRRSSVTFSDIEFVIQDFGKGRSYSDNDSNVDSDLSSDWEDGGLDNGGVVHARHSRRESFMTAMEHEMAASKDESKANQQGRQCEELRHSSSRKSRQGKDVAITRRRSFHARNCRSSRSNSSILTAGSSDQSISFGGCRRACSLGPSKSMAELQGPMSCKLLTHPICEDEVDTATPPKVQCKRGIFRKNSTSSALSVEAAPAPSSSPGKNTGDRSGYPITGNGRRDSFLSTCSAQSYSGSSSTSRNTCTGLSGTDAPYSPSPLAGAVQQGQQAMTRFQTNQSCSITTRCSSVPTEGLAQKCSCFSDQKCGLQPSRWAPARRSKAMTDMRQTFLSCRSITSCDEKNNNNDIPTINIKHDCLERVGQAKKLQPSVLGMVFCQQSNWLPAEPASLRQRGVLQRDDSNGSLLPMRPALQKSRGSTAMNDKVLRINEDKVFAAWENLYKMIGGDEFFLCHLNSKPLMWKKFVQTLNESGEAYGKETLAARMVADAGGGGESDGDDVFEPVAATTAPTQLNQSHKLAPTKGNPAKTVCSNKYADDKGTENALAGDIEKDNVIYTCELLAKAFRKAVVDHRAGVLNGTLLHYICRLDPPNEAIAACIRASPSVASLTDNQHHRPLDFVYKQLVGMLEERCTGLSDCKWHNFMELFATVQHDVQLAKQIVEMRGGSWDDTLLHHVVWQADPPLDIVDKLLQASPSAVALANKFGSTPLHHAVQQNISNLDLLTKLINEDKGKSTLSTHGQYGYTPLHLVVAKPGVDSLAAVRLIFLLSQPPAVDPSHLVTITNKNAETPLAQAVQTGAPTELIKELLHADEKLVTLTMKDCFGMRPLCQAIKKGLPARTVEVLIDNSPYELIDVLLRNAIGKKQATTFRKKSSVRATRHPGINAQMPSMQNKADPMDNESDGVVDVPLRYFPSLAKYVSTCKQCQNLLNQRSADRTTTAVVLADFYVYVLLVWAFSTSSDVAVRSWVGLTEDNEKPLSNTLYALSVYLALRELLQWKTQGINWLINVWNWLDVTNLVLVTVCARLMKSGEESDATRYLLMSTGAMVWMTLLTFLRSTFLPFSVFVTGFNNIIWKVIPFLVSSAIVLGAFVHMYYVDSAGTDRCQGLLAIGEGTTGRNQGVDYSKFCTYEGTFIKIYHMFVGGIDEYLFSNGGVEQRSWMKEEDGMKYSTLFISVLFGLLVQILLLNIIIVIVNESWEDVSRHGAKVFWEHRLIFLSEVKTVDASNYHAWTVATKALDCVALKLTKFLFIGSLRDEGKENMFDYMTSLQDDGFLTEICKEWRLAKYERRCYVRKTYIVAKALHHCILFVSLCTVCLIGGCITFGLLWPRNLRYYLFGRNAVNGMEPPGHMSNEIRLMGQKLDLLEKSIHGMASNGFSSKPTSVKPHAGIGDTHHDEHHNNFQSGRNLLDENAIDLKDYYQVLAQQQEQRSNRLEGKVDALLSVLVTKQQTECN